MNPHVVDKKSEESDPKRQKLEEEDEKSEFEYSSSDSDCSIDSSDIQIFNEELERSGDYDFDTTKQGRIVGRRAVVFEDSVIADEPETDGEFLQRLSMIAFKKYNDDENTNLEFVRAVKASWHTGGGIYFIHHVRGQI